MRNPVEEYEIARSMPIPELEAVMLGRSDAVGMAVAHAALKEKLEAEVAKRGANAAAQAQAPKVRDKDLMQARGLGGLAGMQTMAGGGEVKRFQAGGMGAPMQSTIRPGAGVTAAQAFPGYTPPAQPSLMSRIGSVAKRGLGALGVGQLALGGDSLNVGEEDYLEMLRRLRALGYTDDQIATMPDEMRRQIASGKAIHSGTAAEPKLGRLTGETTAPPEGAPTGGPRAGMSVPPDLSTKPMTPEEALKAQEAFMVSPEETEKLFGALRNNLELSQAAKRLQFDQSLPKDKAYEGLERLLNAQATNSAKEKDMVVAESLLNMAAGIQASRSIIQGVAGGAISGLKGLRELNKAETERQKALATIEEARRAERIGNEKERLKLEDKLEDQMSSIKTDEINFLAKNITGGKAAAAKLYADSVNNAQQNQRAIYEQEQATKRTQMTVDRVKETKDPLEKIALDAMLDPLKRQELETLRKTNPGLYNAIMAKINALSVLNEIPSGAKIRN